MDDATTELRALVDEDNTRHYIDGVSLSVATRSWRSEIRTQRAKVYEAGEDDGPEVHGVDNVTTIKLEESTSDTLTSENSIKRRTYHKAVC